ncbi:hypothetical protein QYE76_012832 [Lolium multiflorum]|uniref:Transposase (putative) gypsy type domain-containing protein n=1 Tax=Lolium multiflorum TaxID=4521 RepID=A0AAD8U1V2_LOLMU|nr:hypothetical protein QYE76_012832 [Lolium multiflorum]
MSIIVELVNSGIEGLHERDIFDLFLPEFDKPWVIHLRDLTPNSILHISIFITLCEAFLGVSPNWALWKRIFFCRRNGSPNVAYNIGGVVISIRSTADYFDVKLPDSVQGWRKRWLYIREENDGCLEDNIPPFDGAEKILRRRSWDAEATEEERTSTESLMARIHELQNTRGKELSGIQIIVYFLKSRVQPLQARKFPLWKYTGNEDVDRLSVDLEVKDLERLVRKITSLSKKDAIPSSCRVKPYSATHALPKNHPNLVSLPPLPEGGEVEERTVISNDNQEASSFVNEPADSRKSAGSAEKDAASEDTTSAQSPPPADSPKNKRKRGDVEDSGTSKPEEAAPLPQKAAYDPYLASIISSDDDEETPALDVAARTSMSHTLVISEPRVEGEESSPPQQNIGASTPPSSPRAPSPKRARTEIVSEPTLQLSSSSNLLMEDPVIKDLLRIGAQFVGYREYANKAEEKLAEANDRANTLAQQLEQSEKARKKAESDAIDARAEADKAKADAAGVEDLRKRLHTAETSLSDHIAAQSAREEAIRKRLTTQSRRFVARTAQEFQLDEPANDSLLDALSLLEVHGSEARGGIDQAKAGLSRLFPYFFPKKEEPATFLDLAKCFNPSEDLGLRVRHENMKIAVENTVALVADSQQSIDWSKVGDTDQIEQSRWRSLIKAAKPNTRKILAYIGIKPSSTPSSSKPELIFDNYTPAPGSSNILPSPPRRTPADASSAEDSLPQELDELRHQLQFVKKQSLVLMEKARKSSEAEEIALQQAQTAIAEKDSAVAEADAAASRENSMLQLLTDASLDMAGAFLDPITEDERVEARSNVLLRLAHEHGSTFWGTPERTRQIVRFQDRALQVREYLDFCTRTLSLVYGTMFPRNKMPETLPALMDKFRDAPRIHGFVRAQLAAGARFAMIMIKICYPKLDVGQIVPKCLEKMSKRKRNFGKYDDIVTPVAEDMMDELLRMDSEFFVKGSYAEHSTRAVNNERLTIDNILGNP